MGNLCIIPARGGSKRIPRKNIKDFLGKPIIAYSIEAAINSKLFDIVMVSTDDPEIAKIALKYGAEVPFLRSAKNSDDFATTFDVIEEVIADYKELDIYIENICCIYSCAPFVTGAKLINSYMHMVANDFDTVFPIMEFSFPIQRAIKLKGQNIEMFYPEHLLSRSQDLEKSFHDAGQYYWARTDILLLKKRLVTDNSGAVIISELEGQDIDNESDWKLAELKFQLDQ